MRCTQRNRGSVREKVGRQEEGQVRRMQARRQDRERGMQGEGGKKAGQGEGDGGRRWEDGRTERGG